MGEWDRISSAEPLEGARPLDSAAGPAVGDEGAWPAVRGVRYVGALDSFEPITDTILPGGSYTFTNVYIPTDVVPGGNYTLSTYLTTTPDVTPTGSVNIHLKTPDEFGGLPVEYFKDGDWVYVNQGGIVHDLTPLPPTFPVVSIAARVYYECSAPDCVQLTGFYQGVPITTVTTQGISSTEVLELPPPPGPLPYYDAFHLDGYGFFSFFHWWVWIINP